MKGTTIYLPADLVVYIDKVKASRMEPTRADALRFLVLHALADLSLLPEESKKAVGKRGD